MPVKTVVIKADSLPCAALNAAATALAQGELVAFPTETVYGLGANACFDASVAAIFQVKGRPQDNPLIVHLSGLHQLAQVACRIPDLAYRLWEQFAPGPLTLVLERNPSFSPRASAGLSTVAVRFPAHPVAQELLRLAQVPVVAPSANISGRPSPTTAAHVWQDLGGKIPYIIDGGSAEYGVESTVLDLSGAEAYLLRPGHIALEVLEQVLARPILSAQAGQIDAPRAPGMKYKHYAPRGELKILPWGELGTRLLAVREFLRTQAGPWALLLPADMEAPLQEIRLAQSGVHCQFLPPGAQHGSKELFAFFRWADDLRSASLLVQAYPPRGEALAYMNRLNKAAGR